MDNSELQMIIKRLQAMQKDQRTNYQERSFDVYGIQMATVSYDRLNNLFTVTEVRTNRHFIFDEIDLAAIDIYEILHQLKSVF